MPWYKLIQQHRECVNMEQAIGHFDEACLVAGYKAVGRLEYEGLAGLGLGPLEAVSEARRG